MLAEALRIDVTSFFFYTIQPWRLLSLRSDVNLLILLFSHKKWSEQARPRLCLTTLRPRQLMGAVTAAVASKRTSARIHLYLQPPSPCTLSSTYVRRFMNASSRRFRGGARSWVPRATWGPLWPASREVTNLFCYEGFCGLKIFILISRSILMCIRLYERS